MWYSVKVQQQMAQCEKERKKDGSESESRIQVAGFEHHIIIGFPFFKTDQWMCKLQEDMNIFFWKCGNKKCCRNQAEIAVVLSDSLPYRRFNLISQHRHCTVQTRSSFFKLVGISLLRLYKNWAVEKSFIKTWRNILDVSSHNRYIRNKNGGRYWFHWHHDPSFK